MNTGTHNGILESVSVDVECSANRVGRSIRLGLSEEHVLVGPQEPFPGPGDGVPRDDVQLACIHPEVSVAVGAHQKVADPISVHVASRTDGMAEPVVLVLSDERDVGCLEGANTWRGKAGGEDGVDAADVGHWVVVPVPADQHVIEAVTVQVPGGPDGVSGFLCLHLASEGKGHVDQCVLARAVAQVSAPDQVGFSCSCTGLAVEVGRHDEVAQVVAVDIADIAEAGACTVAHDLTDEAVVRITEVEGAGLPAGKASLHTDGCGGLNGPVVAIKGRDDTGPLITRLEPLGRDLARIGRRLDVEVTGVKGARTDAIAGGGGGRAAPWCPFFFHSSL